MKREKEILDQRRRVFGENLSAIRESRGFSQASFCREIEKRFGPLGLRCGVDYLSKVENGKTGHRDIFLVAAEQILETTVSELYQASRKQPASKA